MSDATMTAIAARALAGAEIVVAEGSMGLFDGVRGETGRTGASADLAALFGWPVLLVLDVSGHAQSAGAVALGCARFDPRIALAGVVLNKVASPRHRRLVEDGLARVGIPVLGALPRDSELALPERHLGLVQAQETAELEARLERLADAIEAAVDLDALMAAAAPTRGLADAPDAAAIPPPGQRIALAKDTAFSFVYPHHLAAWRDAGAEIVPFSPLADEAPCADCGRLLAAGGLSRAARRAPRGCGALPGGRARPFAETKPVHGECGGYMTLGRTLTDAEGATHPMLDLAPRRDELRQAQVQPRLPHRDADPGRPARARGRAPRGPRVPLRLGDGARRGPRDGLLPTFVDAEGRRGFGARGAPRSAG